MRAVRSLVLPLSALAVVVTMLAWVHDAREAARRRTEAEKAPRKIDLAKWNKPLEEGRCAIAVARFGGGRARLVRVETGGTVHFAVVESTTRNSPMNTLYQGDWLRAKYGSAQTTTLGTFGSTQAALNRASRLCPPALRCLPGRPGCDEVDVSSSPVQMFGLPAPAPTW